MKLFKKIICIVIVTLFSLVIYSSIVKAATNLKVTADTLNLREKASTSSDILTLLSKGDTLELVEEDGDWYKVKFDKYTGYVSKEYAKKVETDAEKDNNESSTSTMEKENTEKNDSSKVENNNKTSNVGSVEIVGKISKKTALKILPLIYSSDIDTLNKNEQVTILSEINGWSYIQTETLTGWVRTDSIEGRKTNTSNTVVDTDNNVETTNQTDITDTNDEDENNNSEDAYNTVNNNTDNETSNNASSNTDTDNTSDANHTKKTMYINDSFVNVRKGPSTSSEKLMTLELNTKLTVIGESGDWYKVSTSMGDAYVLKELLSSKQVTTSRGGSITSSKNVVSSNSDTKEDTKVSSQTVSKVNTSTSEKADSKDTSTTIAAKTEETEKKTASTTKGQEIVKYAKQFLGVPYVYGGASKSGFDCSGFTMYVYKKFGISMRHGAQAQAKLGKEVKANKKSASSLKENLQAGDLVFFLDYETMDEIGHCGIYIGDGKFIHASSGSGYCVKINSLLPGEYYNTRYCGARRLL